MRSGEPRFRIVSIAGSLLLAAAVASAQQGVVDLEGRPANPLSSGAGKIVVLVFLRRDCPVSARYARSIQRISKRYADAAGFWLVYPDKSDNPSDIRKSVTDYGYHLPVLRDPEHALVKLSHVQITPEVGVFDRHQRLIYDGRIDNWYVDLALARPAPTTHELEDAIRAATEASAVAPSEVRGVGCYISDLE